MPKLPKAIQKAAENAEIQDFSAVPGGLYRIKVEEIDTKPAQSGNPMWTFKLGILAGPNDLEDEQYKGRKVWDRVVHTEAAAWKSKEVFSALGFTLDSDSDELIGEVAQVMVSQSEIEQGARKGQMGNNIDRWLEDTSSDGDLVGAGAGAKSGGKTKGKDDF